MQMNASFALRCSSRRKPRTYVLGYSAIHGFIGTDICKDTVTFGFNIDEFLYEFPKKEKKYRERSTEFRERIWPMTVKEYLNQLVGDEDELCPQTMRDMIEITHIKHELES